MVAFSDCGSHIPIRPDLSGLNSRTLLNLSSHTPGPMSKRVVAALLGVPLSLATLGGACSLTFNFYVEYWWMPFDKYGVRTPLRWQDVVFIAAVWSVLLVLFYVSYRLLKFAFHRERSA
jgi:hypothetical protein